MPKFTITTDAGDGPETFDDPLEFPDIKAATDDAQIALAEMARDKLPNGTKADFGVKVEDDTGKEIYRAGLSFNAKTEMDLDRDSDESVAAENEITANPAAGKFEP